jgi:hypothetical protein
MVAAGTPLDENGNVEETSPETSPQTSPNAETSPSETSPKEPAQEEVAKFIRWVRRGTPTRPFNFEHLDHAYAEVLNKFVEEKDLDGARWYAERYLGM